MINFNSINDVDNSRYKDLTIPLYDSYCFSNIFPAIKRIFGDEIKSNLPRVALEDHGLNTNKVIFFLVDAFGWSFYERYKRESSFLKSIEERGVVSKLTSQFPSTTTAHVTTAVTGLPVYSHGLYEWFYYEPEADDIITAFLYKNARSKENQVLENKIKDPHSFIPKENFFKDLSGLGVKSTVYQPTFINSSIYTKTTMDGANLKGYDSYEDLFHSLIMDVSKNEEKEYYYIYLPEIDDIAHRRGNTSKTFNNKVNEFLGYMDTFLEEGNEKFKDTLIIMTADHGQIDTDLKEKNYLNHIISNIEEYIVKNSKGELLCPAGYCRDFFLHIQDDKLEFVKGMIEEKLSDILDVYTFEEFEKIGVFGEVTGRLRERCGNLILIPKGNKNIWWYEEKVFGTNLKGVHGGLSKEEMEIPLFIYKFDNNKKDNL
ncbi:MAG: alkaline phosphatase family protein [Clostridium sp.]